MAWLGSTFGDGLTSLKGQITKITKDVLAEDPLGTTSFEGRIKELEDICECHVQEIKKLRQENTALKSNNSFDWGDDQIQDVCSLETQNLELVAEKNRLEKLLEALDLDYQKELEIIVKDRDHWKRVAQNNSLVNCNNSSSHYEELNAAIAQLNLQNDLLLEESKCKEKELDLYKAELVRLKEELTANGKDAVFSGARPNSNSNLESISLAIPKTRAVIGDENNLNEILKEKDSELNILSDELGHSRNDNRVLTDENARLDRSRQLLCREKEDLELLVKSLEANVKELQSSLVKERQSVSDLNAKYLEAVSYLEKLEREKDDTETKVAVVIESMQGEQVDLVRKLKEAETGNVQEHCHYTEIIDGLKEEKVMLINKCEDLLEEINASQQLVQKLQQVVQDEKKANEKSAGLIAGITDENKLLKDKLEAASSNLETVRFAQEELMKERNIVSNSMLSNQEELSAIKAENVDFKEKLEKSESAIENLEKQLIDMKITQERLMSEKLELVQILDNLKNSSSMDTLNVENESLRNDVRALTASNEEKVKEILLLKASFEKLVAENSSMAKQLQESVKNSSVVENLQDQIATVLATCAEKDKQMQILQGNREELVEEIAVLNGRINELRNNDDTLRLNEELASLKENFRRVSLEKEEVQNRLTKLSEEKQMLHKQNEQFARQLQEISETPQVLPDWLRSVEDLIKQLVLCTGTPVTEPGNLVSCLEEINVKISQLVAERSCTGSNTLGLEIRKLKGLVNRIRRDFLQSTSERGQVEVYTDVDEQGESPLSESQTDDVKQLKQDIAQMTEILGMIDRGLTGVLREKSRLEKELSILKSVSSKTEKELTSSIKARDLWNEEKKQLLLSIQTKESELESIVSEKVSTEQEVVALKKIVLEGEEKLKFTLEEREKLEKELMLLSERFRDKEELEAKVMKLESLNDEKTKFIESLTKECADRDATIVGLTSRGSGECDIDWKVIASEWEKKCELAEAKNAELEVSSLLKIPVEEKIGLEDMIGRLQQENADLKGLVQQLRESIFAMGAKNDGEASSDSHHGQQHRRSLSQGLIDSSGVSAEAVRADLEQERTRCQTLLLQNQALTEKEANMRKELERLRAHLVEVEDHYTTEAVQAEQTITEYRTKLAVVDDQLRNSSTVYKSANVRSTQHVEALQNQIRLMSVQRDDLQAKLSIAEDQMQKQSASLASLQMVLEQFQLDKERELQTVTNKHEYQLQLAARRSAEQEAEINSLKDQLAEAKNGLKAALRLSEQLEKKSQIIAALEEEIKKGQLDLSEANKKLATVNEYTTGKVDKFLVKNLVLGYFTAGQGNTKTQALKILASVLDLSEEERLKVGVDGQSGWFSHLLHPSPGGTSNSEPLSQAFVRFLESESRPQPQLKLLPESASLNPVTPKRPQSVLSNLVLPSVTPTQVSDKASSSLNDVLKDS